MAEQLMLDIELTRERERRKQIIDERLAALEEKEEQKETRPRLHS
jgi:hypothetical protein